MAILDVPSPADAEASIANSRAASIAFRLALDYERLLSRLTIERSELRPKMLAMQTAIADLSSALTRLLGRSN